MRLSLPGLWVAFLQFGVVAFCRQEAPNSFPDRREFARRMAKITEGMPAAEVEAILGRPDDIRTQNDPGGITTTRTLEVWRYGTNGHLTFPALGQVYIDNARKAQYVYGGGGEPPAAGLFGEADLRRLLSIIDRAPAISGWSYDPLPVIEVVNALQPLGKEKALAAIEEYLRVASRFHSDAAEGGLFLVLRVLFDVPAGPGHMPPMILGAPSPAAPGDPKRIPRFPVALVDDVPILLINGYLLAGVPEPVENHVKYFRDQGTLRNRPLEPGGAPLAVMEKLEPVVALLHPAGDSWVNHHRAMMRNQVLRVVDSVYRLKTDRIRPGPEGDTRWKTILEEFSKLEIRWDAGKGRYTFKDGSQLPEVSAKIYRREIWKLEGLGQEASLILERRDDRHVGVTVQQTLKAGEKSPRWSVRLFRLKDREKTLAQFPRTGGPGSGVRATAGAVSFASESSVMALPEGEEVQAEFKLGEKSALSPVYKP